MKLSHLLVVEDMTSFSLPEPDTSSPTEQLEKAMRQLFAARKALGIVNRLSTGETKTRHASRVLTVLNKIRGSIARIEKQIKVDLQQQPQ